MKRFILGCAFLLGFHTNFSQSKTFISAATGGNWNVGTTWGLSCTSNCVEGDDYPGPNDYVYIAVDAGSRVTISRIGSPSYSCKDLLFVSDIAGSLRVGGTSGVATLTINGQISGVTSDLLDYQEPTVDVFQTSVENLNLVFTGTNLDNPISGSVITNWGHASPFYRITLNPGSGNSLRVDSHSIRNSAVVQSGTVQINSNQVIQDGGGTAQFIVNASSSLNVLGAINGDGSTSSRFSTLTINGTLTTGVSAYVNAVNFTLGPASTLNVGFNGVNQTQGWWYQSIAPITPQLDATSSVNYNSSASQNIHSTTYGNLSLTSGTPVTKALSGTGLTIQGNLNVGNNITFSPASEVDFSGTTAQTISGGGSLSFAGGIEVNKSGGTLNLSKDMSANGITITSGTLDMGNVNTTLLGGNFINSGTVTSGASGTLTISGTSTFSGTGSLLLNHLVVNGSASFNNSAFTVTGNIANQGAISVASTSTVTFSGGIPQSISGNIFSLGNMIVNKPLATLTNNGNVELLGVLTMTTGTLDADGTTGGNFILNSDTNGDAAIGPMGTGSSIGGEVTFERYFDNASTSWRNIAFPVEDVTYAELGASVSLVNGSLATYNERALGDVDQGWNIVSSGTLNSKLGHTLYMFDQGPITISVKGRPLQRVPSTSGTPYDYGVSYTNDATQLPTHNGWNLIPNPYASPINWNASSGWVKTNVVASAAVWDAQNGAYHYSAVDWDGVVAQGQSFWIQTNATLPKLTSTESVKVTDSNPAYYRTKAGDQQDNRLLITLSNTDKKDKAVVQFRKGATPEFDPQFDASKLKNTIFNLSSLSSGGLNLAANALPMKSCTAVKLNIDNIPFGKYSLKFDGILSFVDVEVVRLFDHYSNTSRILRDGESISFSVDENPASFGSERFELRFTFPDESLQLPQITVRNKKLISNYENGNQWYLNGVAIPGATNNEITASRIGTYELAVDIDGCTRISQEVEVSNGASRAFPNPAKDIITVDLGGGLTTGNGHIYMLTPFGDIALNENFVASEISKEISVSDLKPGMYLLRIVDAGGRVLLDDRIVIRR